MCYIFFFFNDTATTEIYTLSLHDALPISNLTWLVNSMTWDIRRKEGAPELMIVFVTVGLILLRSEEHTSELQSQSNLVCRLLLEKKKKSHPSQIRHHVSLRTPDSVTMSVL